MSFAKRRYIIILLILGVSSFYYYHSGRNSRRIEYYMWKASIHNRIYDRITGLDNGQFQTNNNIKYPRLVNTLLTDQYPELAERFQRTIDKNDPANSKAVVELVQEMLDAPTIGQKRKLSNHVRHTPQSLVLTRYFKEIGLESGFFIECGALDGERSSSSLYLEYHYNWTGVLIEADPYFYTQLLGKRRNAWSINACLSPSNHTMWADFAGSSHGRGKITNVTNNKAKKIGIKVPCFPLESILLAIGRTKVDYFSLDVEGAEIPILKSIPFARISVDVWTIEYPKVDPERLVELMEGYGFDAKEKINSFREKGLGLSGYARDFLFVKKENINFNDKRNII